MLVSITGADGVGKSTVSALLERTIVEQGHDFKVLDRWDVCNSEQFPHCRFIGMPKEKLRHCVSDMTGPARALFIFWTLYTVMESYDPNDGSVTFIDSYWMKHAAAEVAYGLPEAYVESLLSLLPKADLTILLEAPAQVTYARKEKAGFVDLVPYECGMDSRVSRDSFIGHQARLSAQLKQWSLEHQWQVIDTTVPLEQVTKQVIAIVESLAVNSRDQAI
jgi:dTMP kinase